MLGAKKFGDQKKLKVQKNCRSKKFVGPKNLGVQRFGSKKF